MEKNFRFKVLTSGIVLMTSCLSFLRTSEVFNENISKIEKRLNDDTIYLGTFDSEKHKSLELANYHHDYINDKDVFIPPASYERVFVNNEKALYDLLKETEGNTVFFIEDGEYTFNQALVITKPNIIIMSESRDPNKVIFNGVGMVASGTIGNLIEVNANGFYLEGITLQKASHHLIQIRAEANADFPIIRNAILRDSYQQMIKVSYNAKNKPQNISDSGLIERCLFEYTNGVGPNYYIGGIDAHGVRNWVIQKNTFKYIASPSANIAEYAIHLWNNAENNKVIDNIIIDSDRGIGFGMLTRLQGNENIKFSNLGGLIEGNVIYHSKNTHIFGDVGIALENSPSTIVRNNYIYFEHDYSNAIEYRFPPTQNVLIENNFTNKRIQSRDGASATVANNNTSLSKVDFIMKLVELSEDSLWFDPAAQTQKND